jgi:PiT family inorganic phosphate transporter
MEFLLIPFALFLAFGNGANDNFKGFATVWGSATLSYRHALLLATAATLAGSVLSLYLANGLVQQFSGKGLLPQAIIDMPIFITSVALAAALTVFLATRLGLPISTTHALIGGLIGAGLAAAPGAVQFARLGNTFLLPLLVSPVVAAACGLLAFRVLGRSPAKNDCACVVLPQLALQPAQGAASMRVGLPQAIVASASSCDTLAPQPLLRFSMTAWLNRLHIGSASLICFARAVNDTPKLAALLIAAHVLSGPASIVLIAGAMALGGLMFARRVAQTMSQRITQLDPAQGLAANLITATLVLGASQFGLPVSTTHVSVGSIAGVGGSAVNWSALRGVLLSWVATLPMAAGIAWVAFRVF